MQRNTSNKTVADINADNISVFTRAELQTSEPFLRIHKQEAENKVSKVTTKRLLISLGMSVWSELLTDSGEALLCL